MALRRAVQVIVSGLLLVLLLVARPLSRLTIEPLLSSDRRILRWLFHAGTFPCKETAQLLHTLLPSSKLFSRSNPDSAHVGVSLVTGEMRVVARQQVGQFRIRPWFKALTSDCVVLSLDQVSACNPITKSGRDSKVGTSSCSPTSPISPSSFFMRASRLMAHSLLPGLCW